MPKPWVEEFDVYMARFDEHVASIVVDLAAIQAAPLATHPQRLFVRIKMKHPRPDGLRSAEEQVAIGAAEDALLAALAKLDALFVGRIGTRGNMDLFLFAPPAVDAGAVARALDASSGEYEVVFRLTDDPTWSSYFEFLAPSQEEYAAMQDRRVLESLAAQGDDHDLPRPVDHFAYFPDERSASQARDALTRAGFSAASPRPPQPDGPPSWSLAFQRTEPVTPQALQTARTEFLPLLEACGGTYDGWGCPVTKPS